MGRRKRRVSVYRCWPAQGGKKEHLEGLKKYRQPDRDEGRGRGLGLRNGELCDALSRQGFQRRLQSGDLGEIDLLLRLAPLRPKLVAWNRPRSIKDATQFCFVFVNGGQPVERRLATGRQLRLLQPERCVLNTERETEPGGQGQERNRGTADDRPSPSPPDANCIALILQLFWPWRAGPP